MKGVHLKHVKHDRQCDSTDAAKYGTKHVNANIGDITASGWWSLATCGWILYCRFQGATRTASGIYTHVIHNLYASIAQPTPARLCPNARQRELVSRASVASVYVSLLLAYGAGEVLRCTATNCLHQGTNGVVLNELLRVQPPQVADDI